METVKYIKSFSKGQITIPKAFRDVFGIGDTFWLKVQIRDGKIIAEPVKQDRDTQNYKKRLLTIKGSWVEPNELAENRVEIEQRLRTRPL